MSAEAPESREVRLKRLTIRSSRRGTREMDLILMRFVAARLDTLEDGALDRYEALLDEGDQDIYAWISGREEAPADHAPIVRAIAETTG